MKASVCSNWAGRRRDAAWTGCMLEPGFSAEPKGFSRGVVLQNGFAGGTPPVWERNCSLLNHQNYVT